MLDQNLLAVAVRLGGPASSVPEVAGELGVGGGPQVGTSLAVGTSPGTCLGMAGRMSCTTMLARVLGV